MFCPYLYEQEGHISSLSIQLASKGVLCIRLSLTYLTYPRLAVKE
jgi:hypothetical protein